MTGLEPAIYGVTGRRDNQLRYTLISARRNYNVVAFLSTPRTILFFDFPISDCHAIIDKLYCNEHKVSIRSAEEQPKEGPYAIGNHGVFPADGIPAVGYHR